MEHKCCICGKTFSGYGNNPWPLKVKGVCCDDCNSYYVIAARLINMRTNQKPSLEEVKKWLDGEEI